MIPRGARPDNSISRHRTVSCNRGRRRNGPFPVPRISDTDRIGKRPKVLAGRYCPRITRIDANCLVARTLASLASLTSTFHSRLFAPFAGGIPTAFHRRWAARFLIDRQSRERNAGSGNQARRKGGATGNIKGRSMWGRQIAMKEATQGASRRTLQPSPIDAGEEAASAAQTWHRNMRRRAVTME